MTIGKKIQRIILLFGILYLCIATSMSFYNFYDRNKLKVELADTSGRLALILIQKREYERALQCIEDAAELVKNIDQEKYLQFMNGKALVFYLKGNANDDCSALNKSIAIQKKTLTKINKNQTELWINAYNTLGNAFLVLGILESNPVHLENAKEAYEAALEKANQMENETLQGIQGNLEKTQKEIEKLRGKTV